MHALDIGNLSKISSLPSLPTQEIIKTIPNRAQATLLTFQKLRHEFKKWHRKRKSIRGWQNNPLSSIGHIIICLEQAQVNFNTFNKQYGWLFLQHCSKDESDLVPNPHSIITIRYLLKRKSQREDNIREKETLGMKIYLFHVHPIKKDQRQEFLRRESWRGIKVKAIGIVPLPPHVHQHMDFLVRPKSRPKIVHDGTTVPGLRFCLLCLVKKIRKKSETLGGEVHVHCTLAVRRIIIAESSILIRNTWKEGGCRGRDLGSM